LIARQRQQILNKSKEGLFTDSLSLELGKPVIENNGGGNADQFDDESNEFVQPSDIQVNFFS
jgi:hypothetical protein